MKKENPVKPNLAEQVPKQDGKSKKSASKANKRSKPKELFDFANVVENAAPSSTQVELLEVDPNDGRRKRRKTASLGARSKSTADALLPDTVRDSEIPFTNNTASAVAAEATPFQNEQNPMLIVPEDSSMIDRDVASSSSTALDASQKLDDQRLCNHPPLQNTEESKALAANSIAKTNPKKVLIFNSKTGTIGSPPPPKVLPPIQLAPKKSAGRRRKSESKIVTIFYGPGHLISQDIGPKIDKILCSKKAITTTTNLPEASNTKLPARSVQSKSTHPFFLGKPKFISPPKAVQNQSATIDLTENSPSQTRPQVREKHASVTQGSVPIFSTLVNPAKITKVSGAVEPAWPWKGVVHIRGHNATPPANDPSTIFQLDVRAKSKKGKSNAIQIPSTEDVVDCLARNLRISHVKESIQNINPDEFPLMPMALRPASKHNESGLDIQRRVHKQLYHRHLLADLQQRNDSSSEDDIAVASKNRPLVHRALTQAYTSIVTSLSAFDRGQCETQTWAQKHSPACAAEVLQPGNEAVLLREWLQALTVNAVGITLADGVRAATRKAPKRKQKAMKLDGFVVSSGEEDFDPYEVSEPNSEISPDKNASRTKKTFVKSGVSKQSGKPNNAMLLSGPSGSCKTAAVYAVAKELGFEVFEINSGTRRSGKDIMDKVGDMTRNHLVHLSTIQPMQPLDADEERINAALASDLQSGRQGTMNSFFAAKPGFQFNTKTSKPKAVQRISEDVIKTTTAKQPHREQKQSLILIEEADILFKEDTQFWTTIINLITSSKRPMVITCNDECLIDTTSLALHGILRFTQPPTDLAVDYMLCIAACEGHVLKRGAVQSLYESRGRDLRASIMDLNFWCQFGVGSDRGGLDWFYPRWPRGNDVDKHGKTIRVVSEDTYQPGMGLVGQDHLVSDMFYLDIEEETFLETWDRFQLDTSESHGNLKLPAWAAKIQGLSETRQDYQAALSIYEEYLEIMSDADVCSSAKMASSFEALPDISAPDLKQKALDDFILPHKVIATLEPLNSSNIAKELSLWIRSRNREYFHLSQHTKHGFEAQPELDRLTEFEITQAIQGSTLAVDNQLTPKDIFNAFNPISTTEKTYVSSTPTAVSSIFKGCLGPIVQDAAPYVRSIMAYDTRLAQERTRLSNLLSEGGQRGKRMRTTRAAMSALEGGARKTTRKEKYFDVSLNSYLVANTGMSSWMEASVTQTANTNEVAGSQQCRKSSNGSIEIDLDEVKMTESTG